MKSPKLKYSVMNCRSSSSKVGESLSTNEAFNSLASFSKERVRDWSRIGMSGYRDFTSRASVKPARGSGFPSRGKSMSEMMPNM